MAPRVSDPQLLHDLVNDLEMRADAWKRQGVEGGEDERLCRAKAGVLEEFAQELIVASFFRMPSLES